jgi:hypothetical protein
MQSLRDSFAIQFEQAVINAFIDNAYMLLSHSRLFGHTAVTVVQAALPWQEHSCSEPF